MKNRNRRKCHAARRRANRLRREAARADLARRSGMMAAVRDSVPDAVDPDEAYEAGRAANASCAVGCALALAAAVALLVWWCR